VDWSWQDVPPEVSDEQNKVACACDVYPPERVLKREKLDKKIECVFELPLVL